jgi:hypothetical protein
VKCSVCRNDLEEGDKIVYNHRETFVFKPAHVKDTVNPAVVSQGELLESRKEHTRTEVATTYGDYGKAQIPDLAFGIRHVACLQPTGSSAGAHPINKHHARYQRTMMRRGSH